MLVTLPLEVAESVETWRQASGASSASDALKILIEVGLKTKDTPEALFNRCVTATSKNQSVGGILDSIVTDHPLIASTSTDKDGFYIYLRSAPDEKEERFYFARAKRQWVWQRRDDYGDFGNKKAEPPPRKGASDLDDEIPF